MTDKTPRPTRPTRSGGSTLFRIALLLFVIGLAAIVAIFLVAAFSTSKPALWLYLVAMSATPLGFLLALVFTLRSGRRAR